MKYQPVGISLTTTVTRSYNKVQVFVEKKKKVVYEYGIKLLISKRSIHMSIKTDKVT